MVVLMPGRNLVVISNRGPVSWSEGDDGELVARRGGGGLVSGLLPLIEGTDATWVACAMTDADRRAAEQGLVAGGLRSVMVTPPPEQYAMAYDVVSNATLWFLHHGLFDLTRRPVFGARWREAWQAYRAFNQAFAAATAEIAPRGATVLVQDYHLCLVPALLSQLRPDLGIGHFSHTPFAAPGEWSVLPDDVAHELLSSMAAARACGFHDQRWADRFGACCEDRGLRPPPSFVAPLGPDAAALAAAAASPAAVAAGELLDQLVAGRRVILRVDRIEPSKNLLRGMLALDELLTRRPKLASEVVMLALAYPSRDGLASYMAYRAELETLVARLNSKWSSGGRRVIELMTSDDYPRSVAALGRYDVLIVNPLRDGLNLVAKEGPLLNGKHGVVVLSRQAGAWPELQRGAIGVNPFDIGATADALEAALEMGDAERARRCTLLEEASGAHTPTTWLEAQVAAVEGRASSE